MTQPPRRTGGRGRSWAGTGPGTAPAAGHVDLTEGPPADVVDRNAAHDAALADRLAARRDPAVALTAAALLLFAIFAALVVVAAYFADRDLRRLVHALDLARRPTNGP